MSAPTVLTDFFWSSLAGRAGSITVACVEPSPVGQERTLKHVGQISRYRTLECGTSWISRRKAAVIGTPPLRTV